MWWARRKAQNQIQRREYQTPYGKLVSINRGYWFGLLRLLGNLVRVELHGEREPNPDVMTLIEKANEVLPDLIEKARTEVSQLGEYPYFCEISDVDYAFPYKDWEFGLGFSSREDVLLSGFDVYFRDGEIVATSDDLEKYWEEYESSGS